MRIVALFGLREYEPNSPELLVAWDEYSIDQNMEGWQEAKEREIKAIGPDLLTHAEITINVDEDSILSILLPKEGTIKGTISE